MTTKSPKLQITLKRGDSLEVLKTYADNTFDSLVTDPPSGIGFMAKDWDGEAIFKFQMPLILTECLRVMKPGAWGLVWALPRTSHWTATALEYAGFEIRDVIVHIAGQGFPKSLNVGKAVDERQGNEREVIGQKTHARKGVAVAEERTAVGAGAFGQSKTTDETVGTSTAEGYGTALKPSSEHWILVRKKDNKCNDPAQYVAQSTQPTMLGSNEAQVLLALTTARLRSVETTLEAIVPLGKAGAESDQMAMCLSELATIKNDLSTVLLWSSTSEEHSPLMKQSITLMATAQTITSAISKFFQEASTENSTLTSITPNSEHYILIRKPCSEATVADNWIKHGVGGINIDGCRIGNESTPNPATNPLYRQNNDYKVPAGGELSNGAVSWTSGTNPVNAAGRFPSNTIFSHEADCVKVGSVTEEVPINVLEEWSGFGQKERPDYKQTVSTTTTERYACVPECAVRMLDNQTGLNRGACAPVKSGYSGEAKNGIYHDYAQRGDDGATFYGSKGGASRFFKQFHPKETECQQGTINERTRNQSSTVSHAASRVRGAETLTAPESAASVAETMASQAGEGFITEPRKPIQSPNHVPAGLKDNTDITKTTLTQQQLSGSAPTATESTMLSDTKEREELSLEQKSQTYLPKVSNGTEHFVSGCKFAYVAKPSKREKNAGLPEGEKCTHPTVKPIELMTYLIRLVTPPGGTVFDPFMGSGTTGCAAVRGGWNFTGIERDKEYFNIAKARITYWSKPQKKKNKKPTSGKE